LWQNSVYEGNGQEEGNYVPRAERLLLCCEV